jgi:hypothetical protein
MISFTQLAAPGSSYTIISYNMSAVRVAPAAAASLGALSSLKVRTISDMNCSVWA